MPSTAIQTHPNPQLARETWLCLDGEWEVAFDDGDAGLDAGWDQSWDGVSHQRIVVPFAPEARASGVADTGWHRVVWYRRTFALASPRRGCHWVLHFDAVDFSCQVWVDGYLIGTHSGGHTPFALRVPARVGVAGEHTVTLRAMDDPLDLAQPRGKQDWLLDPHSVWYTRTTGIWRTVWLEEVAETHITSIDWVTDLAAATVTCTVSMSRPLGAGSRLAISASLDGAAFAYAEAGAAGWTASVDLRPEALRAGQARESIQWSPEHPTLIDADVTVLAVDGEPDRVTSYFGVRSATVGPNRFQLNGVPYFVRAVLEQCYWPDSLMTPPSDAARRHEIELAKALGFNALRVHQTVADARFLYWADRLGILVWAEAPAAYEFSARAIERSIGEWVEIVSHYRPHPCVVTWVPLNESWGVQDISHEPRQRDFARTFAALTRALDGTRPVISNDGWEHVDSDILTIHDYGSDPNAVRQRYERRDTALAEPGPQGRTLFVDNSVNPAGRKDAPIMVSEFGGILFAPGRSATWGYSVSLTEDEFVEALRRLFGALNGAPLLAGYCYTQLTDTEQEANGLLTAHRQPKADVDVLRQIVTGVGTDEHPFVWPTPNSQG